MSKIDKNVLKNVEKKDAYRAISKNNHKFIEKVSEEKAEEHRMSEHLQDEASNPFLDGTLRDVPVQDQEDMRDLFWDGDQTKTHIPNHKRAPIRWGNVSLWIFTGLVGLFLLTILIIGILGMLHFF